MKPGVPRQHWSLVVQALLGAVAVLLLTYGGYRVQLDLTTATLLCLIVILVVSLGGYFLPAAFVSVVALLCVNYFFLPSLFSTRAAHLIDEIAVIALLATGLVISRLMARLRQSFSEVQALNQRLQLVVDTIPTLVSRARPDGSADFINRRWQEYLGLSFEEAEDWAWTAVVHPEDRQRFVDLWGAALSSGEPVESEIRIRRSDGEYRWIWNRAVPLHDAQGKIVSWYSASSDIEERKRAEEWARQADQERRIAIDTIPALLWSTHPDGSSDFNNQRWLEYTGLSEKEARGWGYRSVIHPEDYERLVSEWAASFATGEPIEDEARLRRSDGQYRWFLHRAVPLRDERGKIVKWYGTLRLGQCRLARTDAAMLGRQPAEVAIRDAPREGDAENKEGCHGNEHGQALCRDHVAGLVPNLDGRFDPRGNRMKPRRRHRRVVHPGDGTAHDDGRQPPPALGRRGLITLEPRREPQCRAGGQDRDRDGRSDEPWAPGEGRRGVESGHAEIVHPGDRPTHGHCPQREQPPGARAQAHHPERETGCGDGDQNRQDKMYRVVGDRAIVETEGEHPHEVHRPDACPHRDGATQEPDSAYPAGRGDHPACKHQRDVAREGGDDDRHRDERRAIGAGKGGQDWEVYHAKVPIDAAARARGRESNRWCSARCSAASIRATNRSGANGCELASCKRTVGPPRALNLLTGVARAPAWGAAAETAAPTGTARKRPRSHK